MVERDAGDRVDFANSSLTWLSMNGENSGRFALESVCVRPDDTTGLPAVYGLGAEVLAGNVYGTGTLVKHPPYLFQVVASENAHVFFRTHLRHRAAGDSSARNAGLFREIRLRVERHAAEVLEDFPAIERHFDAHSQLSARIDLPHQDSIVRQIEFPVKHINLQRLRGLFQIETGPILFPMEVVSGTAEAQGVRAFNAAFVHFNRLDEIDLTLRVPTRVGLRAPRFHSKTIRLRAAVSLLAHGHYTGTTWP